MTTRRRSRHYLTAQAIGVLFGEAREKQRGHDPGAAEPISPKTVRAYVSHSRMPGGRYVDHPMPMPEYPNPGLPPAGQHAQWYPDDGETVEGLKRRLREWWNTRPVVHTPTSATERRADVAELIRVRAAAGARDQDIASELAEKYGTTPKGKPYTAKVVEGIRTRHSIRGGAFNRTHWHGAPEDTTDGAEVAS